MAQIQTKAGQTEKGRPAVEEQFRNFVRSGFATSMQGYEDEFTLKLAPNGVRIKFDTRELTMGTMLERATIVNMLVADAGVLTINEGRKLMNLAPEKDGDRLLQPRGAPTQVTEEIKDALMRYTGEGRGRYEGPRGHAAGHRRSRRRGGYGTMNGMRTPPLDAYEALAVAEDHRLSAILSMTREQRNAMGFGDILQSTGFVNKEGEVLNRGTVEVLAQTETTLEVRLDGPIWIGQLYDIRSKVESADKKPETVVVRINSGGGSAFAGYMIFNYLYKLKGEGRDHGGQPRGERGGADLPRGRRAADERVSQPGDVPLRSVLDRHPRVRQSRQAGDGGLRDAEGEGAAGSPEPR